MIKIGNDHFEATHLEPKVVVCNRRYVFDAQPARLSSKTVVLDPIGKCPAFIVNSTIARAALEKQHADDVQYKKLIRANVPIATIHKGRDGGMNRVFLDKFGGRMPPANLSPLGYRAASPPPAAATK
jgi:hypothetical protein